LRAWRNIDRLPADPESTRPWLFGWPVTTRSTWRGPGRRGRWRCPGVDVSRLSASADPVLRLVATEAVHEALLVLSEEYRVVLVELYLRDASAAEAAVRIGIPEGTVKSRAHNALRSLRAVLGWGGVVIFGQVPLIHAGPSACGSCSAASARWIAAPSISGTTKPRR
jgi:RNA polymerase sigma-70 factor (ECF subfamily)